MSDAHALLPAGLGAKVEAATGTTLLAVVPRGGGGASREGAELTLRNADGSEQRVYMNYDVNRVGAGDDAAFLREAAILRTLSGPLKSAGVRTATFVAAIPESRALLNGFVAGESNFNKLVSAEDRSRVAHDFMAQLAQLHAIDVAATPVEGMGAVRPIAETIAARLAALRSKTVMEGRDPLLMTTLDWLDANVPAEPSRITIVHGDAGPANFLYADCKVTALLDWELVHYGDPMADLAMLCLRNLFQPFIPLPQAFAAYEAAGGGKVDLDRIRFWRLYFQVGFSGRARYADPAAPPPPNLGMNMVYSTIHRRVLGEALAESAGVALAPVILPDAPPGAHARSFDIALADLSEMIVPRLADQQAAVKAKGLARLIKWWRDSERYEPGFHAAEIVEVGAALGQTFASVAGARAALAEAVAARRIDTATAIRLAHAQASREAALMADAMGGLAKTRFAPLA